MEAIDVEVNGKMGKEVEESPLPFLSWSCVDGRRRAWGRRYPDEKNIEIYPAMA